MPNQESDYRAAYEALVIALMDEIISLSVIRESGYGNADYWEGYVACAASFRRAVEAGMERR